MLQAGLPRLQRAKLVSDGLQFAFPCHEGSGLVLNDVARQGNGTFEGTSNPTWANSERGTVLDLTPTGCRVAIGKYDISGQFTLAWWQRFPSSPTTKGLFSIVNPAASSYLWGYADSAPTWTYRSIHFQHTNGTRWQWPADVEATTWQHWCIVSDGRIGLNGVTLTQTGSFWFTTPFWSYSVIGEAYSTFSANCYMQDIRFYDRALTDQEIMLIAKGLG